MNKLICFSLLSISLSSCYHYINENDLNLLHIGMTKKEVAYALNNEGVTRGASIINGVETEGVQYTSWAPFTNPEDYFLYFEKGKLTQWGRPEDWKNNTQKYEIDLDVKH